MIFEFLHHLLKIALKVWVRFDFKQKMYEIKNFIFKLHVKIQNKALLLPSELHPWGINGLGAKKIAVLYLQTLKQKISFFYILEIETLTSK